MTLIKYKKIFFIFYMVKKCLYIKEKNCIVFFFIQNNEKIILKNNGEPLKYVFQI
jgi:hypothetical protein